MGDGETQNLSGGSTTSEGGISIFQAKMHLLADEVQPLIAYKGPGEEPGFAKDLEAIADSDYWNTLASGGDDGGHHGRVAGDGAAAEIVAMENPPGTTMTS